MKIPVYRQKEQLQQGSFPLISKGTNPELTAAGMLGENIEDIGSAIAIRQAQRKKELDAIDVNRKFYGEGGLVDQVTEITRSFTDLKESDAYGASAKYNKELDKVTRKWLDSFQDEEQKQKAENLALIYGKTKRAEVYKHEATQHQAAKKSAISTALVGAIKRVQNSPGEVDAAVDLFKATVADIHTGVDNTKLIFDAENKIRKAASGASLDKATKAVWKSAMALPQSDGESLIQDSGLPYDQMQKVLTDYRTEKSNQKKRDDEARKRHIKEIQNDFMSRIEDLSLSEVDSSDLDPTGEGSKAWFRAKIEARAKAKKDPFQEYDPETLSKIKKKVNTDPEKVDVQSDIWALVGLGKKGGITPEQAQAVQNTLNTRLKNTPQAKRVAQAQTYLDKARSKGLWSDYIPDNEEAYFKWQDALNDFVEKNPDEDVLAWMQEKIKPEEEAFFKRLLDFNVGWFYEEPLLKLPPEEITPIKKTEKFFSISKESSGQTVGKQGLFDPDGKGYDMASAERFGLKPDKTGHWQSRIPNSMPPGLLLKGRGHETFDKTLKAEKELGNQIVKYNGRYYSMSPKEMRAFNALVQENKRRMKTGSPLIRMNQKNLKKAEKQIND